MLTIQTELLDGVLEGARIIDIGRMKPCQCFVLPYNSIEKVGKEYLIGKHAFYILLGNKFLGNENRAYIGKTEDFTKRVIDHKQKKDWWDTALVFISKNNLYTNEIDYLEYLGWKEAVRCDRYIIENVNHIKEPRLQKNIKKELDMFFEDIKLITEFYGCKLFVELQDPWQEMGCHERFYLSRKTKGISASVRYFIMQKRYYLEKGSTISAKETTCGKEVKELRKKLIENTELCKKDGDVYRLIEGTNIPVESGKPSFVASLITGTSMAGTTEFINKEGKTFKELFPEV